MAPRQGPIEQAVSNSSEDSATSQSSHATGVSTAGLGSSGGPSKDDRALLVLEEIHYPLTSQEEQLPILLLAQDIMTGDSSSITTGIPVGEMNTGFAFRQWYDSIRPQESHLASEESTSSGSLVKFAFSPPDHNASPQR